MMRALINTLAVAALSLGIACPTPLLASTAQAGTHIAAQETADSVQTALADKVALQLMPPGTYKALMQNEGTAMAQSILESMFAMNGDELAAIAGEDASALPDNGETLGDVVTSQDPHFKERTNIMMAVMMEELGTIIETVEPDFRAALSHSLAARYDSAQLAELNAFFATPTGGKFAGGFMALFMDKATVEASMKMMPALMSAMPAIMEKAEKATAHLPPPSPSASSEDCGPDDAACRAAIDSAVDEAMAAIAAAGLEGPDGASDLTGNDPAYDPLGNGTEPWWDNANWSAADQKKLRKLEAATMTANVEADNAYGAYLDFERAALERTRARYLKEGWVPAAPSATTDPVLEDTPQ